MSTETTDFPRPILRVGDSVRLAEHWLRAHFYTRDTQPRFSEVGEVTAIIELHGEPWMAVVAFPSQPVTLIHHGNLELVPGAPRNPGPGLSFSKRFEALCREAGVTREEVEGGLSLQDFAMRLQRARYRGRK